MNSDHYFSNVMEVMTTNDHLHLKNVITFHSYIAKKGSLKTNFHH